MNLGQCEFIARDQLENSLKDFHGGKAAVTHGHWQTQGECEAIDLEWNHLDQMHRNFVHSMYGKTLRLVRQSGFASSLTHIRVFGIPFVVLMTDVRLAQNFYYQTLTLFNIIHVHVYAEILPEGSDCKGRINWYIVSHPVFKFLHGFLNRRFLAINKVQNEEDKQIRHRRAELKKKGFHFAFDGELNFVTANTLTANTRFPKLNASARLSLKNISNDGLNKVSGGGIDFLVCREKDGGYRVWTDVCPHEGGPLSRGKWCGAQIECPWHGLKFSGVKLSPNHPHAEFANYYLTLDSTNLIIEEKA